jgi:hypothetical protein
MSLYGTLIKQEADYTALVDEKLAECEKIVEVNNTFFFKYLFSILKNKNPNSTERKFARSYRNFASNRKASQNCKLPVSSLKCNYLYC